MENFLYLFLLSLVGGVLGILGGVVFLFSKRASKVLEKYSIPFAAGVLITVSLVGILPEALEMAGNDALFVVLITFFVAFVFEHFFFNIHHHDGGDHKHAMEGSVPLVLVGDTIHNFIDGIAIGASFLANPGLGVITAISTFLHEIPHEIGDFGILLKAGWKKKNILLVNAVSAVTTIFGAMLIFVTPVEEKIIGGMLAVAAGIFLYLGTIDFLPTVVMNRKKTNTLYPLILGIVVVMATLLFIPHHHEEGEVQDQVQENHAEEIKY